jgi:PKD repeat protein
MHDMTYHYGFDEEAGNFQELNYSGLGLGSDFVNAEALDGSGTSNANFSTPPDGNNGRMQMYVFTAFNPNGQDKDSGLDNGIIAHEYGHGISNRLTGGASNTSCLFNQEQMGEGWSDYYAMITTIDHGDNRNTKRPLGTYALGQAVDGPGIRNKLYSTDMAVNSYTYGDLKFTGGETHNIGEIWTVMLWDLTWDLIDTLGYDPDIMYGKGGNNVALRLVTEAMKLQVCSPGFVDGRDAILQADQLYYNGTYQCMIWKAFARRGLGYSADQGSSDNYNDGTEAFDIPPYCLIAVNAPIAHFSADRTQTCLQASSIQFNDQTENIAQYWFWDFGDGSTSTKANPIHSFPAEGKYTIKLIVTNNIGSDTLIRENYITISELPAPSSKDTTVCAGQSAQLNAVVNDPNNIPQWLDANGNLLATGATFVTPNLTQATSYLVRETSSLPVKNVGPTALGAGGFHNSTTIGKIYFTAYRGFTIRSVLVRAQGAGNRTVQLFDEADNVIQTFTIYMLSGQKRVDLNITIPGAGKYALGAGPNTKLFRSSDNISYPYTLSNVVQITGAGQGLGNFYFYFYDWEIQETACISASAPVKVFVTPGPLADFSIATNTTQATFTDLSSGNPSSWLWNFGDGSTSTEANPLHTYATMGVFPVSLTVSDGNCSNTYEKTLDFTSSTQSLPTSVLSIQLAPNPATDQVDLRLSGSYQGAFSVILLSSEGRMLRNLALDTQQGPVFPINLEGFASGVYFVKIETTRGVVIRKLVLR